MVCEVGGGGGRGDDCLIHLCCVRKHYKWHHLLVCVNTSVYLIREPSPHIATCAAQRQMQTDVDVFSYTIHTVNTLKVLDYYILVYFLCSLVDLFEEKLPEQALQLTCLHTEPSVSHLIK